MWKYVLLLIILLVIIAAVIEVNEVNRYYSTLLSLNGLVKHGMYKTTNGTIFVSTKRFKVLPHGFYPICPIMLIGTQIEEFVLNAIYSILYVDKTLFTTEIIRSLLPVVDTIKSPRLKQNTNGLFFASNNPNLKIIMCRKQGKEQYYVK